VTEAVLTARPGDVIVLRPGVYRLNATPIRLTASGAVEAPIVLRAERLGDAVIEADALEAITVLGPFWHIENLVVKGVCDRADDCKDAIHVIDDANDVVISNNRLEDFNTHIKADGQDTLFPDRGRIVGNTLTDTTPRASRKPMAGIDLIGVNDWQIQDNVIADVVREAGAAPTYGASARGAGVNTVFERNVVICAWHNANRAGQQIGISLGGPGTAREMRRDKGQTGFEQVGGSVRDNLIVSCSDHGISLTRAARSVVDRNTLLDTAGIEGRFVETSGTVTANIVDGALRALDGAVLQRWDNDVPWLLSLLLGLHPQRNYYRDPRRLDLAWRQMPAPASERTIRADLCDQPRSALAPAGAFEMYAACQSAAAVAAEPGAASGR